MADRLDPQALAELNEAYLLGDVTLTAQQIADAVGIDMETARNRWRSLGFSEVGDDVVAFTEADLDAMRRFQHLHELGLVGAEDESALIRTLGRSFARLAEWQLTLLGNLVDPENADLQEMVELVEDIVPNVEAIQSYVWRRHLSNVAARMLLAPSAQDAPTVAVGFADIVGYTRQSRAMTKDELARLVGDFEAAALRIITSHQGRIIKTIGDEVMFVVDEPHHAAEIALELIELHPNDEECPELRVGLAYGQVLSRLGDVFGPTVNIAARLTSVSRPGKVLVDRGLAEAISDDARFWVRRTRRQSVKGYRRLEPWKLRRFDPNLTSPAAYLQQKGRDFLRAVDEVQLRREGAAGGEGLEEPPGGEDPGPVVPSDQHHG